MDEDRGSSADDRWQLALHDAAHRFSRELRALHDTNPWPENPVLAQALNSLATELWDRCFSLTEIRSALVDAADDLPRYAAGVELRP